MAVVTLYTPVVKYVAMGDSFSSGEGNPPFEAGTDEGGVNECHRSDRAYPRLIAGSSNGIPSLSLTDFRACSGAVTSNIWDIAQVNEGIQVDSFPDDGFNFRCIYMQDGGSNWAEAQGIRNILTMLNNGIRSTVVANGSSRLHLSTPMA